MTDNVDTVVEDKMEFVLKNKDYFLLFIGSVVSNMGTQIYNFAMSLYILLITDGDPVQAGLYLAFGAGVFFIMTPFAGALVDRFDKVRVVYLTDLINGIAIMVAGYFIFSGISTEMIIVVLYISSFVLGVNGSLFNPAARSLPPHILEENQLQQSSSLTQGMYALYGILGPVLGGLIYGIFSGHMEVVFWINGLSFLASGISEMFIRIKTNDEEHVTLTFKTTLVDIKDGFAYLWRLKGIRNMLLIAALLNFFTTPVIMNGFPYLFNVELGVPVANYSATMSAFPIGIIISSILLGAKKQKERVSPMMVLGLFGMSITFSMFTIGLYLILSDIISFPVFMAITLSVTVVMGFFNAFINVPFSVAIMKSVEKPMMGRVFGATTILSNGVTPIAIAIGGIVISYLGVFNLTLVASIMMFVTTLLTKFNGPISEI
jgi:MFS family permease